MSNGYIPPFALHDERMVDNLKRKICEPGGSMKYPITPSAVDLMRALVPMYRHKWVAGNADDGLYKYLEAKAKAEPSIAYVCYDIESICACVRRASTQMVGDGFEYRSDTCIASEQTTLNDEAAGTARRHNTYMVPFSGQL